MMWSMTNRSLLVHDVAADTAPAAGTARLRHATDRAPAWSLAVLAMLFVQLGSAFSTTLFGIVGTAGTAWLRLVAARNAAAGQAPPVTGSVG